MMQVRAQTMYLSIAPQKLRLVCDQVRGLGAEQALSILKFMPKKGAKMVSKTLSSAIANAANNNDLDVGNLYVEKIHADEGPSLKRYKAGARGRYKPRKRRTSHLTIILAEREE
jgi:large subunit ribosomal protein L22